MRVDVTPIFDRTAQVDKRIICYRGGTRSSKSYSLMQKAALWLWTGKISGKYVPKGIFSITRATLPALKATVLADFIAFLFAQDMYSYIQHLKTTNDFIYNGRKVSFFSLDDEHKLRGRANTFLWINEANNVSFDVFNQAIIRLEETVFLDYNPSGTSWVKTEIEEKRLIKRKDVHLDISVYTDNPFLPDRLIEEIEGLKDVDYDLWRIYTKGEWVSLKGLIFPNYQLIDEIPLIGRVYYGVDFGYTAPSVLIKTVIDGDNMYIESLIYQRELLIDELAAQMKNYIRASDIVYCDSAEPRTIAELRRRGINAKPAKKGADSIRQGLGFIKQHYLHIKSSSVETIKEFEAYKWAEDKEGRLTDKPITAFDHSADALRYSVSGALGSKFRLL